MTPQKVERVLSLLGCHSIRHQGSKVISSCPFAPWRHGGGADSSPSFAALRSLNGFWSYNCLACGERGTMVGLFWRHWKMSGKMIKEVNTLVYGDYEEEKPRRQFATLDYAVGGSKISRAAERPMVVGREVPTGAQESMWEAQRYVGSKAVVAEHPKESELASFGSDPHPYWMDRGFGTRSWSDWEMRYDHRTRRVVFPCRNHERKLVGWTKRLVWNEPHCFRCGALIVDEAKSAEKGRMVHVPRCKCGQFYVKYHHWSGPWRNYVVYGEHRFTEGHPVVVTEGPTDAVRLWEHGVVNPCCVFGAQVSEAQAQSCARAGAGVVLLGDGDAAGRQMMERAERLFKCDVTKVMLPDGLDPDGMGSELAREMLPAACFG